MFQFLLGVLILASNFLGVSRASAETHYIEVFPSIDSVGYVTLTPPVGGNWYGFRDFKGAYPDSSGLMCYGDVWAVPAAFAGHYTMENCWANGAGNTPDGTYWTAVTFAGSPYTPDWTGDVYYWRATRSVGSWSSYAPSPPFQLAFPLKDRKDNFLTAYTAPIISVFDHSMVSSKRPGVVHLYGCDGKVLAFTYEGLKIYGADSPDCKQPGYLQDGFGSLFSLAGVNYEGTRKDGPQYLEYDGHPGYDYHAAEDLYLPRLPAQFFIHGKQWV